MIQAYVGVGGDRVDKPPPLKVKPYVVKYEFQYSFMYCVPPLKPKIRLLLAHVWIHVTVQNFTPFQCLCLKLPKTILQFCVILCLPF